MILICHAYSRDNHGDGLLVDLAVSLVRKAVPEEERITVLALDARSFSDMPSVEQSDFYSDVRAERTIRAINGLLYLSSGMTSGRNRRLFGTARLVVGVGGGYLRAGSFLEGLKALVAHGTQLRMAVNSGRPTFYLPQSVGPLRGCIGARLRRLIAKLDEIAVRDDRSRDELGESPRVIRAPDLAVMEIARLENLAPLSSYENVYLIARRLSLPAEVEQSYIESLQALKTRIPEMLLIMQSSGRGNDDASFYDSLGWNERYASIEDAIAAKGKGVVISVRLHGSLESVLRGCPSVHLSYERKGFGAYSDLGLTDYVHNASTFSPDKVVAQVMALKNDPSDYWSTISRSRDGIQEMERVLIERIRSAYHRFSGDET